MGEYTNIHVRVVTRCHSCGACHGTGSMFLVVTLGVRLKPNVPFHCAYAKILGLSIEGHMILGMIFDFIRGGPNYAWGNWYWLRIGPQLSGT